MTWDAKNKTCWDLRTLTAISGFEAISSSRAIFNATHTSLPIVRRTEVAPFDGGAPSTEGDLLSEFFEADNTDGALIIPVIGDRGVGKSHIIRFLYENRPIDPRFHVVYIPKSGTDLRTTIGLIIDGLDERFNEIRESLATAQAHNPDPEELVQRLLVELFLKIKKRADLPLAEDDVSTTTLVNFAANLLNDAHFREKFAATKAPRRILAGPLGENDDDDIPDEKRTLFSLDDLPIGKIDVNDLSESARGAFRQFSATPAPRKKLLQFINEALPAALQEVFWSNGPKLTTLLRDVRRLLLEDDREIFLLIEDLVVLSGLQEELLQAFITPAVELPGQPKSLAPLRVAFAMTNEPFRAIQETVVSRIKSVYAIDLSQDREGVASQSFGKDAQIAFLSKYLNASRYSIDEISEFDKDNIGQPLPSKCDTCKVADKCLSDFGTHNGIGMYPFTKPALTNLLQARSPESFNPRGAIRGVLAEVLREGYDEIPNGIFPSDQLMNDFKNDQNVVPLEVMSEIEFKFGTDSSNRINLQRFWSSHRSVRDPWTEWIRESFGLGDDSNRVPQSQDAIVTEPAVQDLPPQTGDNFSYLDNWAIGGDVIIPGPNAHSLRSILYELVSGQLEDRYGISISKPLFQVGQTGTFLQRDSFIIAQAGGGGNVGEHPIFWTTKIDVSVSTALIFKRLLQTSTTGHLLTPSQLSEVYNFIEPMVQSAKHEYDLRYGNLSEEIDHLKFFASIFGTFDDLLDNLLSDQVELDRRTAGRSPEWVGLIDKWKDIRGKSLELILSVLGAAKGDGGTISTRLSAILPKQDSTKSSLATSAQTLANKELDSDNAKRSAISSLLNAHDPKELFKQLRNSLTEIDLHLAGLLIPQAQLFDLVRHLDDLDKNWNSHLLELKLPSDSDLESIVKSITETDTRLIDKFLEEMKEILKAVDGIVAKTTQFGTGNSAPNATLIEIQSSLQNIQAALELLK